MPPNDRRRPVPSTSKELLEQLNELQLETARGLERFGWDLRFVRKRPFQPAVPVMFGDNSFLCLHEDGTMEDEPAIELRQD